MYYMYVVDLKGRKFSVKADGTIWRAPIEFRIVNDEEFAFNAYTFGSPVELERIRRAYYRRWESYTDDLRDNLLPSIYRGVCTRQSVEPSEPPATTWRIPAGTTVQFEPVTTTQDSSVPLSYARTAMLSPEVINEIHEIANRSIREAQIEASRQADQMEHLRDILGIQD